MSTVQVIPQTIKRKTLIRTAAYARVSMEKETAVRSLSAQVEYYTKYIQSNPDYEMAGIYIDEAKSGTKDTRENFVRLLEDCESGKIDLIIGFSEHSAEIRIAQYEAGTRKPKERITAATAKALGVSPLALSIPEIDDPLKLLHTLFALEDTYGEWIEGHKGTVALHFDPYNNQDAARLFVMLCEWRDQYEKRLNGKISKEEYDNWRYNYTDKGGDGN